MVTDQSKYTYSVENSPLYAALNIELEAGQSLIVESSAMAGMDPSLKMKSSMRGGIGKSIGRLFSGESLFVSEFSASQRRGNLYLCPATPGDIFHYYLNGETRLIVQSSGFLACSPTVETETRFEGWRGFFSGESLFLIRAVGEGDFWFSSYGAIIEVPVTGEYVVDTGYIVAFEDSLDYKVELIGGLSFKNLRTGIFGGEGLVCRFRGEGRVWIQSRKLSQLINFLNPFRPIASSNSNDGDD
ncbi:MAG: TIGR00266 family protein [Cyanobacteria bacterium]|jgi:uncharacterized protein (TIGR00266 family)|nr:TIGR00266 family protein [Cyanobacteria bacterium GSL.Bin1]